MLEAIFSTRIAAELQSMFDIGACFAEKGQYEFALRRAAMPQVSALESNRQPNMIVVFRDRASSQITPTDRSKPHTCDRSIDRG
jgi:hypothetical protein